MSEQKIICGDNIEVLKTFPDNSIDAVVTDAPYGLGKQPNAEDVMRDWIEKGYHEVKGGGFMGAKWDRFIPQPLFWREVYRVLKPGAFVLCFFGTRTYDWGVMSMRFAGFRIIDSLHWLNAGGFPKNHNVSVAIDLELGVEPTVTGKKRLWGENASGSAAGLHANGYRQNIIGAEKFIPITEPTSEQAKLYSGFGTALKPAHEPIVFAQKPIQKGLNIAQNILQWGTGAINIDACKTPFKDEDDRMESMQKNRHADFGTKPMENNNTYGDYSMVQRKNYEPQGRWPTNLVLTHADTCRFTSDDDSSKWDCSDGCPIKILNLQSEGSSRFFPNTSFTDFEISSFIYTPKAIRKERNFGLDNFEHKPINESDGEQNQESFQSEGTDKTSPNNHPTLKPVSLMVWLVKLISVPGGKLLDPFNGAGTTGIACKLQGIDYIGIEQDPEYCRISEARISAWSVDINPLRSKNNKSANSRNKVNKRSHTADSISAESSNGQLDIFSESDY